MVAALLLLALPPLAHAFGGDAPGWIGAAGCPCVGLFFLITCQPSRASRVAAGCAVLAVLLVLTPFPPALSSCDCTVRFGSGFCGDLPSLPPCGRFAACGGIAANPCTSVSICDSALPPAPCCTGCCACSMPVFPSAPGDVSISESFVLILRSFVKSALVRAARVGRVHAATVFPKTAVSRELWQVSPLRWCLSSCC